MLMWGWEACHPEDMTSLTGTGCRGPSREEGRFPDLGMLVVCAARPLAWRDPA